LLSRFSLALLFSVLSSRRRQLTMPLALHYVREARLAVLVARLHAEHLAGGVGGGAAGAALT